MTARRWSDLTDRQQTAVLVAVSVQLSLAVTAWTDLARRPAALVTGPKAAWAAAIGINFLGPLAYFRWGRRTGGAVPDTRHRR
jgi:hypothetical protein